MYIDIHTHHPNPSPDVHSVVSLYEHFRTASDNTPCSVGLHPWYLDDIETRWQQLQEAAMKPNVIAIGECGLDKVTPTDWHLQTKAFSRQIGLAQELNKPLIIHCVRAYEEVMQLLSEHKVTVPVIFHGFNKSPQLAEQLLNHGYYLSFGATLLNGGPAIDTFKSVPGNQFFLETDQSAQDIRHIYAAAAEIRRTTEEQLILQLQKNYKTVFNR
ncbi:MAG: TatD family hydrolase [Taibaiella sp.]|nr:TatD family hydrolase [Taibaiella sp.]